jgi:hypothetical protein
MGSWVYREYDGSYEFLNGFRRVFYRGVLKITKAFSADDEPCTDRRSERNANLIVRLILDKMFFDE